MVSLVATLLTAVFVLGTLGIPPAVAGHPTAPATTPLLVDNFTRDSQLNASLWQVNGNNVVNATKQMYPGTVVTPSTSFSSAQGLQMGGVTGAFELTGIGSLHSFLPPFFVNVTVMGTDSHGAAFLLVLTNAPATSWVAVDGYLNSSERSAYGIGLDALSPGGASWTYLGNLASSPALDQWYDITMNVSVSGVAIVGVRSGGTPIRTMQVDVGSGPFVLGLMQAENFPPIVGNNIADWATATVLGPKLVYTQVTYSVTFTEMGLPAGSSWAVTLAGSTVSSTSGTITFTEPNGTYDYIIRGNSSYTATPTTGTATVSGESQNVNVTFTPISSHPGSTGFLGLAGNEGYYGVGGLVAVAVISATVAVIIRRSRLRQAKRGRSFPRQG